MGRTLNAIGNYNVLDAQSRYALDVMSRDIRQTGGLTNFTSTSLACTNTDGSPAGLSYNTNTCQFMHLPSNYPPGATGILLKACTSLNFAMFQRLPGQQLRRHLYVHLLRHQCQGHRNLLDLCPKPIFWPSTNSEV